MARDFHTSQNSTSPVTYKNDGNTAPYPTMPNVR